MIMQSIDSLEAEIASEKEALKHNVDELQERAREVVDWRTQVQRHPLAMVGAALVGGVLLATMFSPARGAAAGAARGLLSLAGSLAPHAGRLLIARRVFGKKSRAPEMPAIKRAMRNARRTASAAASRVADRLHVPGDREAAGARRAKHHPA